MNLQGDKIVKKEDSMLLSDPFEKLKLLLDQGEFELLEDEEEKNKGNRYRLVYLMNDAVESFLVLENGRSDSPSGRICLYVTVYRIKRRSFFVQLWRNRSFLGKRV